MTSSNSASSAPMGSASGGNGALHAPQRPVLARYFAGTRFFCPHCKQTRIAGNLKLLPPRVYRRCSSCLIAFGAYLIAIGLTGDPTARVMGSGGAQKKNS